MRSLYFYMLVLWYLFLLALKPLGGAPGQPGPGCRVGSAAGAAEKLISGWRSGDSSEGKGFVFCFGSVDCFFPPGITWARLCSGTGDGWLLPRSGSVCWCWKPAAQSGELLSVLSRLVSSSR